MIVAKIIFWISLAVCVYIYFGYPALLWIVSKLRSRPVKEADVTPRATFVIPAYNEERNIARKIENTLSLDYPAEQIEVLVVSQPNSVFNRSRGDDVEFVVSQNDLYQFTRIFVVFDVEDFVL